MVLLGYPFLKKRVIDMAHRHTAHSVLIEDKGSGTQLIQDLRHEKTGVRPIPITPEADKEWEGRMRERFGSNGEEAAA